MYKIVRSLEEMDKIRKSFKSNAKKVRHKTAKSAFLKQCEGLIRGTKDPVKLLHEGSPFR